MIIEVYGASMVYFKKKSDNISGFNIQTIGYYNYLLIHEIDNRTCVSVATWYLNIFFFRRKKRNEFLFHLMFEKKKNFFQHLNT